LTVTLYGLHDVLILIRSLQHCETLQLSNILPALWAMTLALQVLRAPYLWNCAEVFKEQLYCFALQCLHNSTAFSHIFAWAQHATATL